MCLSHKMRVQDNRKSMEILACARILILPIHGSPLMRDRAPCLPDLVRDSTVGVHYLLDAVRKQMSRWRSGA